MTKSYRPITFYTLSLLIPWTLWFAAAYISHRPDTVEYQWAQAALGLAGLFAPMLVAAFLLYKQPKLWTDAKHRLFRLTGFPKRYLLAAALLGPVTLVLAQLISIAFRTQLGAVSHFWTSVIYVRLVVAMVHALYCACCRRIGVAQLWHRRAHGTQKPVCCILAIYRVLGVLAHTACLRQRLLPQPNCFRRRTLHG